MSKYVIFHLLFTHFPSNINGKKGFRRKKKYFYHNDLNEKCLGIKACYPGLITSMFAERMKVLEFLSSQRELLNQT